MTLADVLLGVLMDGPAHGYDLKRAHDQRFPGSRSLAYGQVYATLGRMERTGLVEVASTEQDAGPERIVYAMTTAGAAELHEWLGRTEQPGPYAADELVRKTVTALHAGVDTVDFLARQRQAHIEQLRQLVRERDHASGTGAQIALGHSILHLDADLRWLEQARERLADPTRSPR